ncbi:AI-2E family transporter [Candidatus Magnetomonas plexicatena]|uniref:AI-2E family transporter n=1 Tax=Candidatus Magnetomonas plexicatena TaxID=2552947 RepID=UPI0011033BFB|nr:AI-2E family transporter [Nitrospirales bacterium LBB_01]
MTTNDSDKAAVPGYDYISWFIITTALILVLKMHLLWALLAGLAVYEFISILSHHIRFKGISGHGSKLITVSLLVFILLVSLSVLVIAIVYFFRNSADSLPVLLKKMADIMDNSLNSLPHWITEHLPADADGLKTAAADLLRRHASQLQTAGHEAVMGVVHILIGMVIGIVVALSETHHDESSCGPLARALTDSVSRLVSSFRGVVFAQVSISAINTVFSALYLAVALPLFGIHLHLTKTLIAVTFIAGMLPVIGNLFSNTAIIIVSLSQSFNIAIASLVYLILIHKLEYFLNAKLVGSKIHSKSWEILLAIVFMEAAFGMSGLIAAPIYYAYLKSELMSKKLI